MRWALTAFLFAISIPVVSLAATRATGHSGVDDFNRDLETATKQMDNSALLALWENDGVSLLPSTPPIIGRKAIGAFLDDVMARIPGGHMERFEMQCHDIEVSGNWGSEWCTEHQIVRFPDKPTFDGRGKMLFVLHRGRDGRWRIQEEMWNQAEPLAETH